MPKQFLRDLQPQSPVDSVFRVADRQTRANRQGNSYLLLQLQDRTGTISAMRWNADERLADRFPKGSFLRVQGIAQLHNGNLQIIVNQMQRVEPEEVQLEDFDALDKAVNEEQWHVLLGCIGTIKDHTVRVICESIVKDSVLSERLKIAPAGIKAHHAYPGGLLEHIVSLMRLGEACASLYPELDRDLLIAAALVHDLGKTEELAFENELTYSDPGQLLGHLVQGVVLLERIAVDLRKDGVELDGNKLLRLEHIVVSHHGSLEHGSPKVPMTMEALAFHYLDEMDAKLNAAKEQIVQDRSGDAWTPFHPLLGRKLYKPSLQKREKGA